MRILEAMDPAETTPEPFLQAFPHWVAEHFGVVQIILSAVFVLFWLRARSRDEARSAFKLREADRDLKFARGQGGVDATPRKAEKLRLDGIVKDGASHEVLGISALATEPEIQRAYKEKMKRYHPDRIGRPGSPEWIEATAIAEAINRARLDMLERLRKRS